jgi:hypothetical protein
MTPHPTEFLGRLPLPVTRCFSAALGTLIMALPWFAAAVPATDFWPLDATEAQKRQERAAQELQPVTFVISLGGGVDIRWRLVPPGQFIMGSPKSESGHEGDERQHPAGIAQAFYIMETQLTVGQLRALLSADECRELAADLPAAVTYRDAMDRIRPALARHVPTGWKLILPDRTRLEYAARAGVATMNPGGDREEDLDAYGWYQANSGGQPHPVAQKRPNAWGLFDVLGNRWHWIWYGAAGKFGDSSTNSHVVYGGNYRSPAVRNGARLANINISQNPEGVRFVLLQAVDPLPEGHPQ